ncbi:hypothetical protein, partial [Nocardia farcinica]|uniref:hypothetical protein n=1 Tax=Nocardia farcinica TaxID=37329 RepID=UPI003CC7F551
MRTVCAIFTMFDTVLLFSAFQVPSQHTTRRFMVVVSRPTGRPGGPGGGGGGGWRRRPRGGGPPLRVHNGYIRLWERMSSAGL